MKENEEDSELEELIDEKNLRKSLKKLVKNQKSLKPILMKPSSENFCKQNQQRLF